VPNSGKHKNSDEEMSAGSFVQFAEKSGILFNETSVMGCILGPISNPRAEIVYNFTHPRYEKYLKILYIFYFECLYLVIFITITFEDK
jgi:hypothetical protein